MSNIRRFFLRKLPSIFWLASLTLVSVILGIFLVLLVTARAETLQTSDSIVSALQPHLTVLREGYQNLLPNWFRIWFGHFSLQGLYVLIPVVMLLERFFPANPQQKLISRGLKQDLVWFIFITNIFSLTLYSILTSFLYIFFSENLGFLAIDIAKSWPLAMQVLAGFLLWDFMFWFSHLTRHRIRALWLFHSVHHSQKELNIFTDDRRHPVDDFVRLIITFFPMFIFQVSPSFAITFLGLIQSIHGRFVHANVRANLGILGYLIVSPQFHRLHHSKETCHYDLNFGGVLSVWDYLFNTAHHAREEYPVTGVSDPYFPKAQRSSKALQYFITFKKQIIYPFAQMLKQGGFI